ncbi:fibronectin type III domain-containing protein [Mucilaginibacter aquaedulcis]|uniref:fibronectin type III domain-containing protein n=1 Tax=Mucilaginibacter aquaedulcis TaxID=1187081 RepID=UPI0025B41DB1|nr:fibronectin type III domain-containing protein [Mucilaginibacter aquaedulcis]MDN3548768.1 fibronectin type III domain-containing protein [Mucilaginibacter aquaedulcis]
MSKLNKIKLTKDTTLIVSTPTKGEVGKLLVVQDSVGGHQVLLPENNFGKVVIETAPNTTTLLEYYVDDTGIFWSSTILTPAIAFLNPQKITDLSLYIVDSNGAKIKWSAPMGNPADPAEPATRYVVYYSESAIDINYSINDLPRFRQNMVPQAPGSPEQIVITGLLPNHKYYVTVVAETIINSKLKSSLASNIISFTTPANDVVSASASAIIPLNPDAIFGNALVIDKDPDTGQKMYEYHLADLTGIVDNAGIPEGSPPTVGFGIINFGVGDMPQYNRPSWDLLIDLEAQWDIDYIYVWLEANGECDINTSNNGVFWNTVTSLSTSIAHGVWTKLSVNSLYSSNIRYVQLAFRTKQYSIKGLLFYGKRAQRGTVSGIKYKKTVPVRTFEQYLGTNGFVQEDPDMTRQVSGFFRCYVESDWIFRQNGNWHAQGQGYNKTADEVRFVFASSHVWNWDTELTEYKSRNQKVLFTLNNSPLYLRDTGYASAGLAKPVDPGLNPMDLNVTTSPFSYTHYARLAYNVAARYGRNKEVDLNYVQYEADEPFAVGLDLLEYVEFGNEKDAYWTGANGYHSATEMAAIMSAIYDGHKGQMGAGYGFRAADPTMKMGNAGLAISDNIGYIKIMMLWWDTNRGYGDYPIDFISVHYYNSTGGSQAGGTGSGDAHGIPPEQGDYMPTIQKFIDFRNRQLQKCEFFLSEYGYDEHYGGVYSPNYRDLPTRQRHKSFWLIRSFIIGQWMEIDVFNQYWYANTQVVVHIDTDGSANYYNTAPFITSGYVDGIDVASNLTRYPLPSFYYVTSFINVTDGYQFSHLVIKKGERLVNEITFVESDPRLWVAAYKKSDTDTLLIAWLDSTSFQTLQATLRITPSENTITVTHFEDAEFRKDSTPLSSLVQAASDSNGKFVNVEITECPRIFKTINIGVPRLIDPQKVEVEAISYNTIKLAWIDRNIGGNLTKIYQSNTPDGGFEQVVSEYIDNGEYVLTNLSQGENYFFKIGFQLGAFTSELSDTIGITTLSTLASPDNFSAAEVTSNGITLKWNLSAAEQSKIDNFEIYRSLTSNGTYQYLASPPSTSRSYTDFGLTADTTYYYKIRTKKDFGYSEFAFSPGETTQTVNLDPPVLQSAKTNYSGDRIKLKFNNQMANPAGQVAGFSIIETITAGSSQSNGSFSYNVLKCVIDEVDKSVIYLYLDHSILSATSPSLTLSYDATKASIQSFVGTKLLDLQNFSVINNKNNTTLLSKQIQINLTDQLHLAGSGWNDVIINPNGSNTPIDQQAYTVALKDRDNVTTNIEFLMPYQQGVVSTNGYSESNMLNVNDDYFPSVVNDIGVGIANQTYGNSTSLAIFQNLDPLKEYNVRLLLTVNEYNTGTRSVYYKNWQETNYFSANLPGNSISLTSLKTVTSAYIAGDPDLGYAVINNQQTPKVGVNFRYSDQPVWIAGLILEEVFPE